MAAKAKAAPHGKSGGKGKQKNVQRAKPKGLHLTRAQAKAYYKAYSAAATIARNRISLANSSNRFRGYRLGTAHRLAKTVAAQDRRTKAAAIAESAVRHSFTNAQQFHQNAAYLSRVQADLTRHAQAYSRAQFVRAGEKAYLHHSVLATVTSAQAITHERQVFARLAKIYKAQAAKNKAKKKRGRPKGSKNKKVTQRRTTISKAQSAAIRQAGRAAGLAAARKVSPKAKLPQSKAKSAKAKPQGRPKANTTAQAAKNNARGHAIAAQSKKAPAVTPKGRGARSPWAGDEETPNCVITAMANHLLRTRGFTVSPEDICELTEACHPEPLIEEALWQAWLMAWPTRGRMRLKSYREVTGDEMNGSLLIVGYDTEYGPHAALSLPGGEVVSWGTVMKREAPLEEAWRLEWES